MIGLLTAGLIAGVLGSLHCATMCGPLAMTVYGKGINARHWVYNLGRINTYVLLGIAFGALGQGMAFFTSQRMLSVLMGAVILILALYPQVQHRLINTSWHKWIIIPLRENLRSITGRGKLLSVYLIGMLNGLLPCGVVYMALSMATATGDTLEAVLVMLGFGLGTSPMMMSLGLIATILKHKGRFSVRRVIAYASVAVGILLVVRGMALDIPFISPVITAIGLDMEITTCGNP